MQPSASEDTHVHSNDSSSHGFNTAPVPTYRPSKEGVIQQGNDDSAHGMALAQAF